MNKVILLADDDYDDAEIFSDALTMTGYAVELLHFETGKAALDHLNLLRKDGLPHYIFLDINMPILNGWETLSKIKKHNTLKDIPVFMYSTSSYGKDKQLAIEQGAEGYITKPTCISQLVEILKKVLSNKFSEL